MNETLFYSRNSDNSKHRNGVGVIIGKELKQAAANFLTMSDNNMLIQLSGKLMNINIIETYAPLLINLRRNWRVGTENWKNQ